MTAPANPVEPLLADAWINGAAIESTQRFPVINPATLATISSVSDCGADEARAAIAAASAALTHWRSTPPQQRADVLQRWAALIEQSAGALGELISAESGKPNREARGEAEQCASLLRWFADRACEIRVERLPVQESGQQNRIMRQPVGVVACITPWNFPAAAVVVKAGAAIAAGCTAIVKPSEETPLIALALARLAGDAGLPAGVLNVLPCAHPAATGEVLCGDETVRMLSFTGSTRVGKQLYAACSATVKRLALELGGNAPFLVFDDADLERAVDGAINARFYNSGQICVGANRFLVQRSVYDAFASRLAARVAALQPGDGRDANSDIGPMINRAAIERLERIVGNARQLGAELLAGGGARDPDTLFFEPTVLAAMRPAMEAYTTEIFGPVACLYAFDSEAEALQLANDTEAGLAAYVYSGDAERLARVSEALEAGVVGANSSSIFSNDLPFGGIKQSGIGREHGMDCLDEYLEIKSVCEASP